jgi:hypothetical protein
MWFLCLLFFLIPSPIKAADFTASGSTIVTASVGQNRVTITGYTSPNSKVELSNAQVYSQTYSDYSGYFIFDKILLPKETISDLCLTSTDNNSRQTTPICFPAPPATNYHTDIGPVLLPPTISLEESNINPDSTVLTSGQAIPNSQVSLNFYKVTDSAQAFSLFPKLTAFIKPKEALAYSLPSVVATTDKLGNFSLNLPTAYASDYRLYATTKFNNNYSPKSNTLIYILPSLFYLFLQQYPFIKYLIPLLIIALIVTFYFLHRKSLKHKIISKKFLPAVKKYFPAVHNFLPAVRHVSPAITVCKVKKK